jgi:hypothetical protein
MTACRKAGRCNRSHKVERETLTSEPEFATLFPACEQARCVLKKRAELPRRLREDRLPLYLSHCSLKS